MTSPPKSKPHQKFKPYGWVVLGLTIFSILFVITVMILSFYGKTLALQVIEEIVIKESNRRYDINIESLNLNVFKRAITLTNIELTPKNSEAEVVEDNFNNNYSLFIPSAYMQLVSVSDIFLNRELNVFRLALNKPQVKVTHFKRTSEEVVLSENTGDLYEIVSGYISSYQVRNFSIENGSLQYEVNENNDLNEYRLNKFSFFIKNFELDTIKSNDEDKIFYTDQIEFVVKNESVELPDNLHLLTFDSLKISTINSSFGLFNARLKIREKVAADLKDKLESLNKYDLTIPELSVTGLDFTRAYQENRLIIEKILLADAAIKPSLILSSAETEKPDNRIIKVLNRIFDEINIHEMAIRNTSADANFRSNNWNTRFTTRSLDFLLLNVFLDSISSLNGQEKPYFQDFEIRLKNYELLLPDSIHSLASKSLFISSKEKRIMIDSAVIMPVEAQKNIQESKPYTLQIQAPGITITNLEINDFLETGRMTDAQLTIANAIATVRLNSAFTADTNQSSSAVKTNGFVEILHLNSLEIAESELRIFEDLKAAKPSLSLSKITSTFDNIDFFNDGIVPLEDLLSKMAYDGYIGKSTISVSGIPYHIEFEEFEFNSKLDTYEVLGVEVYSRNKDQDSLNLGASKLSLTGLDLSKLLRGDSLESKIVSIQNPIIYFLKRADNVKSRAIPFFSFDSVGVSDGNLDLAISGNTLSISALELGSKFFKSSPNEEAQGVLPFQLEDPRLSFNKLSLKSTKNGPQVNLGRFMLDTGAIHGLNLLVLHDPKDSTMTGYSVEIPRFDIFIPQIEHLFEPEVLEIEKIHIPSSAMNLILPAYTVKTKTETTVPEQLRLIINEFQLDSLTLNAKLQGMPPVNEIQSEKITIGLTNLDLKFPGKPDVADLLKHCTVKSTNNQLLMGNNTYKTSIDTFILKGDKGDIYLGGLLLTDSLWAMAYPNDDLKLTGTLTSTQLHGFNFDSWFNHRSIEFNDWSTTFPKMELTVRGTPSNDTGSKKSSGFRVLRANDFGLNVDSLIINYSTNNTNTYRVHDVQLAGEKIEYFPDSNSLNLVNKNYVAISLSGFKENFNQNTLQFYCNRVAFDSRDSVISLIDLGIEPLYEKSEFAQIIGHQTDWVDFEADSTRIDRFDFYDLLKGDMINCSKIAVYRPRLRVYRDKRVPREANEGFKAWPMEALHKAKASIHIEELDVYDGNIVYSEMVEDGLKPGEIEFDALDARFSNICNVDSTIDQYPIARLTLSSLLMAKSNMVAEFIFQLDRPGFHTATVEIEQMPLTEMNRMFEFTEFIKVKTGRMNRMQMNIQANPRFSTGEMFFYYDKLKLQFINKKNYSTKGVGKAMEDFFANTFVNSSNPAFFHNRRGEIFFERDSTKSLFNFWAKSTLSGVVSSVGLKKNRKELRKLKKGKLLY
jgi:hypothetical protein